MTLTSGKVTGAEIERSSKALLAEWLAYWFDGQSHAVGTSPAVIFPKAKIVFDQGDNEQPKEGTEIRVLCEPGEETSTRRSTGRRALMRVTFAFGVKSKVALTPGRNSKSQTQEVCDRLFHILRNPAATHDLAQKGIRELSPKKPKVMTDDMFASAVILCRGRLVYDVTF